MDEKQAAERERLLHRAEIEARLRALTEERKAELRRSGPLPGEPVVKPIEPVSEPAATATTLEVAETVPPAATESLARTRAVFVPTPPLPADPVADPSADEAAVLDAGPRAPYASAPLGPHDSRDRRPGGKNTSPVRFARQGLGRVRTLPAALETLFGALRSLPRALGSRTVRAPAAPEVASPEPEHLVEAAARNRVADHPTEREQVATEREQAAPEHEPIGRRRTRSRALLAAAAVVLVAIGGYAAFGIADLPIPLVSDGFLAAETAGTGPAEAEGGAHAQPGAAQSGNALRPAEAAGLAAAGSTGVTTAGSSGAARVGFGSDPAADPWTPPAPLAISAPETAAGGEETVELELDLAVPEATRPVLVSDLSPLPTGTPAERPSFIPHDIAPKLRNSAEIQRLLERSYPARLRAAGIEGSVIVWLFIDEQGAVQSAEVQESSGYPSMDEAAVAAAGRMQFSPAMNRDKPIAVWLAQPILFR